MYNGGGGGGGHFLQRHFYNGVGRQNLCDLISKLSPLFFGRNAIFKIFCPSYKGGQILVNFLGKWGLKGCHVLILLYIAVIEVYLQCFTESVSLRDIGEPTSGAELSSPSSLYFKAVRGVHLGSALHAPLTI